MLRKRRVWIGLAVTVLFLALLLYRVDFVAMGRALRHADYTLVLPAALIWFVAAWFRTVRWQYLLRPVKAIAARRLYSTVMIGYMANNVLPVRLGEVVRAYILGEKERASKMSIIATIVVERIFDGLALILLMLVVSLFVPLAPWLQTMARAMSALFLGGLALFIAIGSSEPLSRRLADLLAKLPGGLGARAKGWLNLFLDGLRVLHSPWRLTIVFGLSLFVWLIEAGMYYVMAFAFGLQHLSYRFLVSTATSNLAITLPSSQGGIGPFEYLTRETLVFFGADPSVATAYAIVLHATLLIPVILAGFAFLWLENLSLGQMVREQPASTSRGGGKA